MARVSSIEWTEATWNPVTGCTKISAGCKNCYAERMARRLHAMGVRSYANGFKLTVHETLLGKPLEWKKPQMIFVNSMSDLFHEDVPEGFIVKVFDVMRRAFWHRFQILTKRPERIWGLGDDGSVPDNVWMGATVEASEYLHRVEHLQRSAARVKFLSLEPLLGGMDGLSLKGIDWVIAGGESGPGARPIEERWVIDIRDRCVEAGVPFFFKQWGGFNKKRNGRLLQGRTWDGMPDVGDVRWNGSTRDVGEAVV